MVRGSIRIVFRVLGGGTTARSPGRNSATPGENLGLLANGSSGSWEVSIDESVSGTERSFAQIEGPSLWLCFEIPSSDIIPKIIQFLLPPGTKREEIPSCSSRRGGKLLDISEPEETPVSPVRDDEYRDRCFTVVGRSDSPIVRFSVAGEDLDNLIEALRQVEEDIHPSVPSEEKTNGVVEQESSDRTIWMPSGSGDYVSLWSFAGERLRLATARERLRLASRLLNFMCAHDFADVRIEQRDSHFLKAKAVRSEWNVRSPHVRDIAERLQVDSGSLETFLAEQGFDPVQRGRSISPQRDRWIEKRWKWVGR